MGTHWLHTQHSLVTLWLHTGGYTSNTHWLPHGYILLVTHWWLPIDGYSLMVIHWVHSGCDTGCYLLINTHWLPPGYIPVVTHPSLIGYPLVTYFWLPIDGYLLMITYQWLPTTYTLVVTLVVTCWWVLAGYTPNTHWLSPGYIPVVTHPSLIGFPLVTYFWLPIDGYPSMVTHYIQSGGDTGCYMLMGTHWLHIQHSLVTPWLHTCGYTLMVIHWWLPINGYPLMVTHWKYLGGDTGCSPLVTHPTHTGGNTGPCKELAGSLQDLLAGFNCFGILSQDYLSPLDGIIDRLPNVTPLLSFV